MGLLNKFFILEYLNITRCLESISTLCPGAQSIVRIPTSINNNNNNNNNKEINNQIHNNINIIIKPIIIRFIPHFIPSRKKVYND